VLPFWRHCQTTQEPTTSAFDAAVVPRQGKERRLDEATRVRSSMEKCRRDFKVVRRRKRLFTVLGDLRISEIFAESDLEHIANEVIAFLSICLPSI
jgi:hypothetical protein